jgi:hypothetical protein
LEKRTTNILKLFWVGLSLILLLVIWFLPWRFQVNDDVIMMWLVSGAYTGVEENYAVFLHPGLSWGLSSIYKTWDFSISWYALLWFVCIYYSFLLTHFRIRNTSIPSEWKIFLNVLVLAVTIHLCIFPQFTLVSGFLALASWVYILHKNSQGRFMPNLLFLIGVIFSIMIRAEAFLLVSVGVIYYFFVLKFSFKAYKNIFLLVSLVFSLLAFSKVVYEQNSIFTDFLEFNNLRHQVIDHPVFFEKSVDREFLADDKWLYFSNWFFQDSSLDLDDLKAKKQLLDKEYFSMKYILRSFSRYWEVQTAELFKGFISALLIFLFIGVYQKEKKLFFLFVWFLLFFLANHIFHFRGRVVFLFFIVLLFPVFEGNFKNLSWKIPRVLSLVILTVLVVHFFNFWSEAKKREAYLFEFDALMALSEKNELVMTEGFSLEYFSQMYSRKTPVPFFIHGWISRSPFQEKALNRFGYRSLTEVEKFDLIVLKEKFPFLTKDFMNSISSTFYLETSIETENLILYKYSKESID